MPQFDQCVFFLARFFFLSTVAIWYTQIAEPFQYLFFRAWEYPSSLFLSYLKRKCIYKDSNFAFCRNIGILDPITFYQIFLNFSPTTCFAQLEGKLNKLLITFKIKGKPDLASMIIAFLGKQKKIGETCGKQLIAQFLPQ